MLVQDAAGDASASQKAGSSHCLWKDGRTGGRCRQQDRRTRMQILTAKDPSKKAQLTRFFGSDVVTWTMQV